MAMKKKSETTAQAVSTNKTPLSLIESIKAVLHITQKTPAARLWPMLVGHTGSGKTARITSVARETGRECFTLLLGTSMPEDVLGLPRVVNGKTLYSIPDWADAASEKPCIIFLDELDKARPDVCATVLSMMSGLQVRERALHPDTWIICAGQPREGSEWTGDETSRALLARTVPLAVGDDWSFVAGDAGLPAGALNWCPSRGVELPRLPDLTARAVTWASNAHRLYGEQAEPMIRAVIPSDYISALMDTFNARNTITPESVVKALNADPSRLDAMPWADFCALFPEICATCTPEVLEKAMVRLWGTGEPEQVAETHKKMYERCVDGDVVTLCGDTGLEKKTNKSIEDALTRAAQEVAKNYEARGKK
jgi:SpoVK/Ycf46/Vps4 family AAA+-type ATPase